MPSTKRRPRRSNWAGLHSSGRRATSGSSPSIKASRPSTFAGSTACWSPAAWTDSYACGTPSFLGEKKEFDGLCAKLSGVSYKTQPLSSWFPLPGSQRACWRAIPLPSPTSASPQRTAGSSPSPLTALRKWFMAPHWGGWMDRRMMDENGTDQYFTFLIHLPHMLRWHWIHCVSSHALGPPLVDSILYPAACWRSSSLQCVFFFWQPPPWNELAVQRDQTNSQFWVIPSMPELWWMAVSDAAAVPWQKPRPAP